jgi:hypothetical protein
MPATQSTRFRNHRWLHHNHGPITRRGLVPVRADCGSNGAVTASISTVNTNKTSLPISCNGPASSNRRRSNTTPPPRLSQETTSEQQTVSHWTVTVPPTVGHCRWADLPHMWPPAITAAQPEQVSAQVALLLQSRCLLLIPKFHFLWQELYHHRTRSFPTRSRVQGLRPRASDSGPPEGPVPEFDNKMLSLFTRRTDTL